LITTYFHKSRLVYGLSSFLDKTAAIERVESKVMLMVVSILKLEKNTRRDRIRATLALPRVDTSLAVMLIKNLIKYQEFFGTDERQRFRSILSEKLGSELYDRYIDVPHLSDINIGLIEKLSKRKCVQKSFNAVEDFPTTLSENHFNFIKKNVFHKYGLRELFILKFFCNNGSFRRQTRGSVCRNCDAEDNSREHAVNHCPWFKDLRIKTLEDIHKLMNTSGDLNKALTDIYFMGGDHDKRTRRKLMEILESFCVDLYTKQRPF
jgi:hypothetical protein